MKKSELNSWIAKYFDKEDLTYDDFIGVIEDLDGKVEYLNDKIKEMENVEEWGGKEYGE